MERRCELCNTPYLFKDSLKLFEATVTKSALYGSETWTMTSAMRRRLATTQRQMLRWMVGSWRRVLDGLDQTEGGADRGEDAEDSSAASTHSEPLSDHCDAAEGRQVTQLRGGKGPIG